MAASTFARTMWVSGRTDERNKSQKRRSKNVFNNSIAIEQMANDINKDRAREAKRNRMWQKARNAIRQRNKK